MFTPYLHFPGTCEEAFEFYKSVFGGELAVERYAGSPLASHVPAGFERKIMHANLTGPAGILLGSDGGEVSGEPSRVSLSITAGAADGPGIFERLGAGGNVVMPLGEVFWGGRFGMIQDKYGFTWMLSIEE